MQHEPTTFQLEQDNEQSLPPGYYHARSVAAELAKIWAQSHAGNMYEVKYFAKQAMLVYIDAMSLWKDNTNDTRTNL